MRWLLAAFCLALATSARAAGSYRDGRWEISLDPGAAIPLGATNDLMKNAVTLQGTVAYQYNQYATPGLELGWHFNHHLGGVTAGQLSQDYDKDNLNDRVPYGSNIRDRIFQFTPFVKVGQWVDVMSYKFRPYVVGGIGFYHEWTNSGTITILGRDQISGKQVGPINIGRDTSSNTYFGFTTGGGFEIQVDESAALGFDLRYERTVKPYDDLEFLIPSFRILYLF